MTYLNMTATTKLPAILRRAYSESRLATTQGDYLIGSTDADAQAEMVSIANEGQRELFDRFTMLGQATESVALTSGVALSDLPADLRDSDVLQITWADGPCEGRGVPIRSFADIPLMRQSPDVVYYAPDGVPEFAYLPPADGGKIGWHGAPGMDLTATMRYRTMENQFTAADLDATTATTVCSVPDRMIPVLTLMIAAELCDRYNGGDSGTAALVRGKLDRKVMEWQKKLGRFVGADANEVLEYGGMPAGLEDVGVYHYNDIL